MLESLNLPKFDLSFFGFGVAIEGMSPITDEETAIIANSGKDEKEWEEALDHN